MNESPTQLRSGWKRVRVRDVSKSIQYGHTASAIDRSEGPRFLRITDIQNGRVDWSSVPSCDIPSEDVPKYRLHKGDLVFARTGATTGKSFLIGDCPDAVFASYLIRVGVSSDIDPRYLAAYFQSPDYWQQIEGGKRGIGQPNVNGNVLGDIVFPLAPMEQQKKIVAEIEKQFTRLEAGVAALRRVQANLKRYRASVLKAACEGRLVPTEAELARGEGRSYESADKLLVRILTDRRQKWAGRGKYKEPISPDTSNLSSLPEGWTWLSVEALGFVTKLAGFEYTKYVKYSPEGDLAVIKAENAGRYGFKRTEISRIESTSVANLTRSQLKAGDLLMVFVGAGTGNVARVPDDQSYFLGPNIAMIRIESADVSPAYVEHFLRSPVGNALTLSFAKAVAQPSLSMGTIRMVPVALPPLVEQKRIVAEVERRFSVVDQLDAVVTANLQRATRLRQSILQNAFTEK
jgi:type I restriction enzyme S subunit